MITAALLNLEEIRRRLTTTTVGRQLYLFGEVDSTNAKLRSLAHGGAPEGTVVLAEGQTAGRGRRGQEWFSPSGINLYASALFRPPIAPREIAVFSFSASVALAETIQAWGATPGIKWPNDLLIDDKKVGGTLVECAMRGALVDYLILGVGVNLNVDVQVLHGVLGPGGRFATSLAAALGHEVDRNAFAATYLSRLDAWVDAFRSRGAETVLEAWQRYDILTGRRIEVRGAGVTFEGRALGVDATGCLLARDTLGQRHAVMGEEVRILD